MRLRLLDREVGRLGTAFATIASRGYRPVWTPGRTGFSQNLAPPPHPPRDSRYAHQQFIRC
ncbi:hypothetical protein IE81DRAFT_323927, partial [Ceraceosorus guamensis]